jgi:nickel-dependent lactate racemase
LVTIRKWHSPEIVAHPKSTPGVVQGNVAHRLTTRAAKIAGADFCVNVTLNKARKVTGVFAGQDERVFHAAVRNLESYVLTQPTAPARVIVTSAAGWPLDATFYQAIKGLVGTLPIMAKGGIVVLAAQVKEGLGDRAFACLIRGTKDVVEWSRKLKSGKEFRLGQWQWQRMGWTRARGRVFLVSGLNPGDARAAFTEPYGSLQEAVEEAVKVTRAKRIVVVPEGPYVVTRAHSIPTGRNSGQARLVHR